MHSFLRSLILVTAVFFLTCVAQASVPVPRHVSVEFSSVSWDRPHEDVFYRQAGKDTPVTVPSFRRSALLDYSGPAELVFHRKEKTPEGELRSVPVATVVIPENATRVLLLWATEPDGTCRILALPESPADFPAGHARFYNGTPYRIAVKTSVGVIELPKGEFRQVAGDGSSINFTVQVAYESDGRWKRAGNNLFELTPDMRRTIFLTSSSAEHFKLQTADGAVSTGAVHLFTITD